MSDQPITRFGLTWPNRAAYLESLDRLQDSLDRITDAERAAWRNSETRLG